MRRAAKVDLNHAEIRDGLREKGYSVADCARMGKGFPDLLVADQRKTILVEVKSARGRLTMAQCDFIDKWQGEVIIAYQLQDVTRAFE